MILSINAEKQLSEFKILTKFMIPEKKLREVSMASTVWAEEWREKMRSNRDIVGKVL